MAHSDKNIVITPNISSTTNNPQIVFSGADASLGPQNITLRVYPTSNGTLSFEGSAGQLFSITNSLSGTIFSVNDVSGIPSIEVLDTGIIKLAQYSGRVLIGTGTDNGADKLQVNGSVTSTVLKSTTSTGVAPLTVASTTVVTNLNADLLDGNHAAAFYLASNPSGYTSNTGTVTSVGGTGSYNGLTLSGTVTTSGNLTLGGTPTGTWPISISGNAATASSATTADQIDSVGFINTNQAGVNADTSASNGIAYTTSNNAGSLIGSAQGWPSTDGALYSQHYSSSWEHQIYGDYRTGQIAVRGRNSGTWQTWRTVPTIIIQDTAPTTSVAGNMWWESDTGKLKIYYNDGSSSQWVDAVPIPDLTTYYSKAGGAISGPVVCQSSLTTNVLTTGGTAITGTVTGAWTLTTGSTWQATFADLAEWYTSDYDYEYGTVIVFGGEFETTISTIANDKRVAGVISKDPAFIMNVDQPGPSSCVALQGRLPVKVIGRVSKGDLLVTSNIPGVATANNNAAPYTVIGKAIENKNTEEQGLVLVSVGR
jgi:hypothetical protein